VTLQRLAGLWRNHGASTALPVAIGALLFLEACASGTGDNPFQGSMDTDTVILQVVNQNRYDAEIYLRPRGRRELLATINSGSLQVYDFQWPSGLPLSLELELSVGGRHRFPPFSFAGVDRLVLTIAQDLNRSTLRR
jgi:hypothetical protein